MANVTAATRAMLATTPVRRCRTSTLCRNRAGGADVSSGCLSVATTPIMATGPYLEMFTARSGPPRSIVQYQSPQRP